MKSTKIISTLGIIILIITSIAFDLKPQEIKKAEQMLSVIMESPKKQENLSLEGTLDWVHYGFISGTSIVSRKRNSKQKIGELIKIGFNEVHTYANNSTQYKWIDGFPVDSAQTRSGIFTFGINYGLQFTVPAGEKMNLLKVYTGVWNGKGKFEVSLSDGSAPVFEKIIESPGVKEEDIINKVFIIKYKAKTAGEILTVKITHIAGGDNIQLHAAALSEMKN